jgi:non-ribosomal peptide synthetase component F
VVGTDVANRNRAEVEGLIGFFVNQLVLRGHVDAGQSWREVLRGVREVALSAYAHQDVPFDRVVEVLNPERDLSYAPLFQVKLVLRNAPTEASELPGMVLNFLEVETSTSQFDLVLNLVSTEEGILGVAEYSTELFESAWVNRMLGHYEAALRHLSADAEASVSGVLEVLVESDRQHRLLKEQELEEARRQKFKNIRRRSSNGEASALSETPVGVSNPSGDRGL